jgi:hypothetical protein
MTNPIDPNSVPKPSLNAIPKRDVPVFNLEVLLRSNANANTYQARIANLQVESVERATPRDAIAAIVKEAKKRIAECVAEGSAIPWLDPKESIVEGETRMLVPIHL